MPAKSTASPTTSMLPVRDVDAEAREEVTVTPLASNANVIKNKNGRNLVEAAAASAIVTVTPLDTSESDPIGRYFCKVLVFFKTKNIF